MSLMIYVRITFQSFFFKRYFLVSGYIDTNTENNFIKIPAKYWKIIIYSGISRGFVWAYWFSWSESWKEAGVLTWELSLKGQGLLEKVLHFHSGSLLNTLECFFLGWYLQAQKYLEKIKNNVQNVEKTQFKIGSKN